MAYDKIYYRVRHPDYIRCESLDPEDSGFFKDETGRKGWSQFTKYWDETTWEKERQDADRRVKGDCREIAAMGEREKVMTGKNSLLRHPCLQHIFASSGDMDTSFDSSSVVETLEVPVIADKQLGADLGPVQDVAPQAEVQTARVPTLMSKFYGSDRQRDHGRSCRNAERVKSKKMKILAEHTSPPPFGASVVLGRCDDDTHLDVLFAALPPLQCTPGAMEMHAVLVAHVSAQNDGASTALVPGFITVDLVVPLGEQPEEPYATVHKRLLEKGGTVRSSWRSLLPQQAPEEGRIMQVLLGSKSQEGQATMQ
jgi:hypothetical protein